jgi:membrane-associated phospholipid phosphatase
MEILSWLREIDKQIFILINVKGAVPFLDGFFKLLRTDTTWIPLYAFFLYWLIRYARPFALPFIALTIVCFGLADFISAGILKSHFGRERPCFNPELQPVIRSLVNCGGRFSMPSTHAANHFALSTFWFSAIFLMQGKKWWWLWIWAFLVGYAQIYVGKHYPFDILVGAVLGVIIGLILIVIFSKWMRKDLPRRHKDSKEH